MTQLLDVQNLVTKFYTEDGIVHAVNGISYTLNEGEAMAIVGESGSGKSVGVLSIMGLIPSPPGQVEAGKIVFNGRDILKLSEDEKRQMRGREMAMVFQDPMTSLNPVLTVGRQMTEALELHLGMNKRDADNRAAEMMTLVGIPNALERLSDYPHEFSGGQRQRIGIAMALTCNPSLLIADEPTTALDVTIQAQIVDLVTRLRSQLGMSIIWITHDLGVVTSVVEKVAVMYSGFIIESAPVKELYAKTSHPYTLGLLESLPKVDAREKQRLIPIKGLPPDLLIEPVHCPFAPRCRYALERCWQENPTLEEIAPEHKAACFRWEDIRSGLRITTEEAETTMAGVA
ncbi:MAG: peptide ABC transporter ATP-binding protein [Chloroflexi bacterium]|nr:MAG: peptide ABC transporter ATP-binding protein [Chloroflexota bacterium]